MGDLISKKTIFDYLRKQRAEVMVEKKQAWIYNRRCVQRNGLFNKCIC